MTTIQTYRGSYNPCVSDFNDDDYDYRQERQAAVDALADSIESILTRMSQYWTLYITNNHHEPVGYKRESKLWDLMSTRQQNALFLMLGMPLDDDSTLPCKTPTDKDVRAFAQTIAEDLIDEIKYI